MTLSGWEFMVMEPEVLEISRAGRSAVFTSRSKGKVYTSPALAGLVPTRPTIIRILIVPSNLHSILFPPAFQFFLQQFSSSKDSGLDRSDRDSQDAGNLLVAFLVLVPEEYHFFVARRERVNGFLDAEASLLFNPLRLRIQAPVRNLQSNLTILGLDRL